MQVLKHYVPFYAQQHKLKDKEIEEIKSYDKLLFYLHDRLKNGKPKTHKK